jgi:thiol-disulfide isomerase/thioredoxin
MTFVNEKAHMKRILMILLLGMSFWAGCSNPDTIDPDALELTDLDGNAISLDQYAGKTIFLNFWATWCRDCLAEAPTIVEAREALKGEDIVFLFVSDEDPDRIRKFESSRHYGLTYLLLEGTLKQAGIFYIPQSYVIRDGKVLHAATMKLDWSTQESLTLLKGLLPKDS